MAADPVPVAAIRFTILFIDKPIGVCETICSQKTKGELT